ncbi:hypothetical protein BGX38DRAFT_1190528 [Terfezia claveryi]|nr:hypothetical protein BGX38DRAFT_1190528 [Terfezia claveryi]
MLPKSISCILLSLQIYIVLHLTPSMHSYWSVTSSPGGIETLIPWAIWLQQLFLYFTENSGEFVSFANLCI